MKNRKMPIGQKLIVIMFLMAAMLMLSLTFSGCENTSKVATETKITNNWVVYSVRATDSYENEVYVLRPLLSFDGSSMSFVDTAGAFKVGDIIHFTRK